MVDELVTARFVVVAEPWIKNDPVVVPLPLIVRPPVTVPLPIVELAVA